MPMRQQMIQKQQLLNSLIAFFKSTNQPLPPEVFNGEHDGAFKLGGVWMELTDLFLAVFRLGGLIKVGERVSNQQTDQTDDAERSWSTLQPD